MASVKPARNPLDVNVQAAQAIVARIRERVEALLPKQKVRDSEAGAQQEFSTPHSYAYAVNWIAGIRPGMVVLEPSAGTGNLATWARKAGATVHVNEISERRRAGLKRQGFDPTNVDGENLDNLLDESIVPDRVIMNPPFSQAERMGGKNDLQVAGNHVSQALRRLKPAGRLVAIVGGGIDVAGRPKGGMSMNSRTYAKFWNDVRKYGNVRANVHVAGAVYSRYSTAFGTRVIVIDKVAEGQAAVQGDVLEAEVKSVEELISVMEELRNEAPQQAESRPDEKPGTATTGEGTGTTTEPSASGEQTSTVPEGAGAADEGEGGAETGESPPADTGGLDTDEPGTGGEQTTTAETELDETGGASDAGTEGDGTDAGGGTEGGDAVPSKRSKGGTQQRQL